MAFDPSFKVVGGPFTGGLTIVNSGLFIKQAVSWYVLFNLCFAKIILEPNFELPGAPKHNIKAIQVFENL